MTTFPWNVYIVHSETYWFPLVEHLYAYQLFPPKSSMETPFSPQQFHFEFVYVPPKKQVSPAIG